MKPESAGPLLGLRVLDLSRGVAGAIAGQILADYGAAVLRIEPPGGDPLWDELRGYPVWHRGKSIVEMDLGDGRAQQAIRRRLPRTDVVLESFAPGTMARFGLDYASVKSESPGLVYVSISGYGQSGPDRDRPGFDALLQARTGLQGFQGAALGRPSFCVHPWPSFGAGVLAAIGCLAALLQRVHAGRGQHVETSLLDGVLAQSTMFAVRTERRDSELDAATAPGWTAPTMAIYACGDGRSLHIHTGARGALDRLLEVAGLAKDEFVPPRSGRHFAGDPAAGERLRAALAAAFRSRSRDEWVAALMAADVPVAPCLAPGEALVHPQTKAADLACTVDDPLLGRMTQPGLALRFARTPGAVRGAALRLGMTPNPEAALRHAGWPTEDDEPGDPPSLPAEAPIATSRRDALAAPLDGIRVLDLGMFAAGPYAAMLLADLGADVLKIEPLEGDTMRPAARRFVGLHRGKRGLAIDLKSPRAGGIVDRLTATADVLLHNLRPGVAERLGIGAERLRALNPRLVYVHGTAYGSSGPLAHLGGFDQMLQALCGLEVAQGGEGNSPAQVVGGPLDTASALLTAAGVLMALLERARAGAGQQVECPQLGAALFATAEFSLTSQPGAVALRLDRERAGYGSSYRLYRAADDRWIFVCCPDAAARERLAALFPGGADADTLEAAFAAAPAAVWQERLTAAGIPSELVAPPLGDALLDADGLAATGRVVATPHARYGETRQAGEFIRFSAARCVYRYATPLLGEHTREVLGELGLDAATIDGLRAERVVAWPTGEKQA